MNMTDDRGRPAHGGLNVAELRSLGMRPEDILDFSASVNPLGASPLAIEAARSANMAVYPDSDCLALRDTIGAKLGVAPSGILVGNGSTEIIHLLARAYLESEDTAMVFSPTFGEYEAACRLQGVVPAVLSPSAPGFRWDVQAAIDFIADAKPSIVFMCNPNNPTGVYLEERDVARVADALQGIGLLVLDEAYVSFVDGSWDSLRLLSSMSNVVLLRSMTKDYALTGLRLGYTLASADVIERVRRFQYSWSVNAPAQVAGVTALSDYDHLEKGIEAVKSGREYLEVEARALGLEYAPPTANFLILKVGRAAELRLKLLKRHKICVRDCASFGLPEYIRVGIRTMSENRRLTAALAQELACGQSEQ